MKIAIVGATGLVGRNIIQLCEDNFSSDVEYTLYASKSSEGKVIKINGTEFEIKELKKENIQEHDISLFSAGGERSKEYAKDFINKGSFVIDNSSVFRMNEDVPLIVYGINENEITKDSKLISNPNCTTMGLVMALKPLHDHYTLSSMTPVAYQAVSGSGSEALQSLNNETMLGDKLDSDYKDTYYSNPIARNVIPLAGNLTDNGYSDEEMKFVHESRKILAIPNLIVEPSNARVGVRTGHGTFCSAVFENEIDVEECAELLRNFDGLEVWNESLPTPIDVEGKNEVLVSRLRQGLSSKNILNFWVVSDNLLKGAALNAVQIAKFVESL
tara:strand:+ start:5528 stop:6514 length:987 start_codon:yes stop_codon:yes gene_type:complete